MNAELVCALTFCFQFGQQTLRARIIGDNIGQLAGVQERRIRVGLAIDCDKGAEDVEVITAPQAESATDP